ncbi:hypothetical protein [Mycobacterium sp. GA-2829]|uniref:hypothetical protein n=1 Tax=Mycobacterium sp. GA-2829 TaxID=1772283 RepID=UPI0009E89232|nr:hypothetical protein [Mycobacterium sp. GA-2829]
MTSAGEAGPRYPAPGSAVAGAPPPLQRPLTPADGAVVDTAAPAPAPDAGRPSRPPQGGSRSSVGGRGAPRLTAAAAMVGIAAGLELAGVLARRSRGVKC